MCPLSFIDRQPSTNMLLLHPIQNLRSKICIRLLPQSAIRNPHLFVSAILGPDRTLLEWALNLLSQNINSSNGTQQVAPLAQTWFIRCWASHRGFATRAGRNFTQWNDLCIYFTGAKIQNRFVSFLSLFIIQNFTAKNYWQIVLHCIKCIT